MPDDTLTETIQPTASRSFDWPRIILAAVLGLALLAAAAYAGYWYGTESAKLLHEADQISKPPAVSQPTPTPTPTPTPDPTAGWETYTNDGPGFSFRYPNDWNTLVISQDSEGLLDTIMVAPKATVGGVSKIIETGGGFGGGKFLVSTINLEKGGSQRIISDDNQAVSSKDVVVGGRSGTYYLVEYKRPIPGFEVGDKVIFVTVPKDSNHYFIELLDIKHLQTFDQILSTFRFLD